MLVSLILPCYNPPAGWEDVVCREFHAFRTMIGQKAELIIVIDGPGTNVTSATIDNIRAQIPDVSFITSTENKGKGYATRAGVKQAKGDIIMYTDVDFPYTTQSMNSVFQSLLAGDCDLAAGVKDEKYYAHVPPVRRFISRGLRFFTGMLLAMPVTDTQCGLKGFRKEAKEIFLSTVIDRYLFDLEFIYKSFRRGSIRVCAVPVSLKDNIVFRSMNYSILLPEMLNFLKIFLNRGK